MLYPPSCDWKRRTCMTSKRKYELSPRPAYGNLEHDGQKTSSAFTPALFKVEDGGRNIM